MSSLGNRLTLIAGWALFLLFGLRAHAQQDPMYTMYMWNMMTVNPGYAGSADVMNFTAVVRRQWVGFDGAPATNSFLAHTPLAVKTLGLGLSAVDDKIGPTRTLGVFGDIAYRLQVSPGARLAFGLKAGFNTMRMDLSSVPGTNADDPVFDHAISGKLYPNFGFGLYYWSERGYAGIASPKLLRVVVAGDGEAGTMHLYREQLHFFLTGGYVFALSDQVKFRPSVLAKVVDGAPISGDLSANFLFMEKLWGGAAYRTSKELSLILSYQISDQLRAGYSYDLPLDPTRTHVAGSHEVMISYDLTFTERNLRSPRYF